MNDQEKEKIINHFRYYVDQYHGLEVEGLTDERLLELYQDCLSTEECNRQIRDNAEKATDLFHELQNNLPPENKEVVLFMARYQSWYDIKPNTIKKAARKEFNIPVSPENDRRLNQLFEKADQIRHAHNTAFRSKYRTPLITKYIVWDD